MDFKDRVQDLFFHKNPFGVVIASHLAAQETKGKPEERLEKNFSITRQLYQKGLTKDAIITLYEMIDWTIKLPKELELKYKAKIHQLEQENKVSYISSIERLSKEEGLEQGRREEDFIIAKKMLAKRFDHKIIKEITGLSDRDLLTLED